MSRNYLFLALIVLFVTHFFYYPKWDKSGTEATLSWDVSGYYMYLPAAFIYQDFKTLAWKDEILSKYKPTPELQQAFVHEASGNYVMKYSIGQAVMLTPGFLVGHMWASISSSYPADGFSFPYQFMISMWVLLITFIGLIFLRKSLLRYFGEHATGLSLLGIVLGSNYLNYSAIDGAMTHNTLFTVYALIIYATVRFYEKPSILKALLVGSLVGLAALTRPTEIISCIIPVLWGVNIFKLEKLIERMNFFLSNLQYLLIAGLACAAVGSIQLIYWKFAAGEWIVYSYQEQGFSWLRPHLKDGLVSYKSGWLTYSPFMVFTLVGFYALWKNHRKIFFASALFCALFIYIAFAWDIWWYGGSLGQRAMVQSYPVFAFPLAALFAYLIKASKLIQVPVALLMSLFIYANLWFTHQAHLGGMIHVGQMRKAYFWKTLLTYKADSENLKLLDDVNEVYTGPKDNSKSVFQDTSQLATLSASEQFSKELTIPMEDVDQNFDWIRVSADLTISQKEWFFWTMTQFIVEVKNHSDKVSGHMIRVQRHMDDNQKKKLHIDISKPEKPYTALVVKFWNADGNKEIKIENIKVETFDAG